ncbi:MAG: hypothetical protein JSU70_21820 [Phycisphaerales bacterium]|nr:MAG: hypothetical protein JSU70_21820 [Phycisphaerales bacterium]
MAGGKDQLEMGAVAMEGLLGEFRAGNIYERGLEKIGLKRHLGELSRRWDEKFAGLLAEPSAYSSSKGLPPQGRRDEYLKRIIVGLLEGSEGGMIVNPACVWGRHSRDLARRLRGLNVVGSDIRGAWDWLYGHIPWTRTPANYQFMRDDIFNPKVQGAPSAVVSFGACASLSDAAMDYAIGSHCPLLVCRACCHLYIGGNTDIVKRPDFWNRVSRFQHFIFAKRLAKLRERADGHYFSRKYSAEHYPRSETAKRLTNSKEVIEVARDALSSDICRSIIDLDRYLHLAEAGYDVWYRAEMFIAQIATNTAGTTERGCFAVVDRNL